MDSGIELIRPLLGISRAELRNWATTHDVPFNEDASNASLDYTRNRLRHELLPAASSLMQRDVIAALQRLSLTAQAEDEYLAEQTEILFPPQEMLPTKDLLAAPIAIQRRALHGWLQAHSVGNLTFELIENIRALLPSDAQPAKLNLPGGHWVRRRAGLLFIQANAPHGNV
jgi:tRNA(Ile)-lysidine synthase